jgi:hypothetical protein
MVRSTGLQAVRRRMPLLAFILLLILVVVMLGIACACISDHPAQTVDRALGAIPAAPAVIEVWSFAITLMLVSFVLVRPRRAIHRSSPATLQRFLF